MATWTSTYTGTVLVECWASGGGGFVANTSVRGRGGGGGAYANKSIGVTNGVGYVYNRGLGTLSDGNDTNFTGDAGVFVFAKRGTAAGFTTHGVGGTAAGSTGDVKFSGLNGQDVSDFTPGPGGNGGAAGGPSGDGTGGAGGNGGAIDQNGFPGVQPGGGGGGAGFRTSGTGVQGSGADGAIRIFKATDWDFGTNMPKPGVTPLFVEGNPPPVPPAPFNASYVTEM